MNILKPSRRAVIAGGASLSGLLLASCSRLSEAPQLQDFIGSSEGVTRHAQRLLLSGQPLAREFRPDQMSPIFKVNGSEMPSDPRYADLAAKGFADWRLEVGGLVARPTSFSLADLRALPSRTQITRHDCVEGWSAIGQWTGVPLQLILRSVGLSPRTRFIVLKCADDMDNSSDGSGLYYESIDLFDAFHPQTLLAYAMNGKPLEIGHGAPIRLRVERQLGYKNAKFVMRIEAAESLKGYGMGKGGYWEDRGYQWYAGI